MLIESDTVLAIVDVQEKLVAAMRETTSLVARLQTVVHGARILDLPVLWVEQYPRGLGRTIPELEELLEGFEPQSKSCFSACGLAEFVEALESTGRRQVLLVGLESHVCVYQTAIHLLESGYHVEVVGDAVSSRTLENKELGLRRMERAGAEITSVEMALFELLGRSDRPEFKKLSKLVR
jgi:nicotinamidase-related amidase